MKYFGIIIITLLACNTTISQVSDYQKCEIRAFTSPYSKEAVNIYNEINGQVIMTLYVDSLEVTGHIVSIIAAKEGWLRINTEDFSEGLTSWVKGGELGISTRNYNGEQVILYQQPNKESKEVGVLSEQQIVAVYAGKNHWALVKGKDKNSNLVEGWLEPNMQCGNPYTICP